MSDESKRKGQLTALSIVNRIAQNKPEPTPEPTPPEPINLDPLIESIESISNARVDLSGVVDAIASIKPESTNLLPVVEAIAALDFDIEFDLSAIEKQLFAIASKPETDFKPVVNKLDQIKKAMEKNTDVLTDLVATIKKPKTVKYDDMGRITSIEIK